MGLFTRKKRTGDDASAMMTADLATSRTSEQVVADVTASVQPSFPIWSIDLIRKLVLTTPDLAQAMRRNVLLTNAGFTFSLKGASKRTQEAAQLEIKNFFDEHPGLTKKLTRQIFICGALSAEAIPALNLSDGIDEVRLVKAETIRFKKEILKTAKGERSRFVPHQQQNVGLVRLDSDLYRYEAIETDEDSPYAIPPFISAMRSVIRQHRGTDQLDSIFERIGMFGFLSFLRKKPKVRPGEDNAKYQSRIMNELKDLRDSVTKKLKTGIIFSYDDTKVEHSNVTGDTRGFQDVWRANEEQLASGIDTDLFLLGRSYSYTEAYAKVAARLFQMKLPEINMMIERFYKTTLTYHLRAKGFVFDRISGKFEITSIDPVADAAAEEAKWRATQQRDNVLYARVNNGIIKLDDAAVEMGYEKATGTPRQLSPPVQFGIYEDENVISFERAKKKRTPAGAAVMT